MNMEYNFNGKIHQTHYQPKKILCMHCNELRTPGTFIDVENHIILYAHKKLRSNASSCNNIISSINNLNARKNREENDPTSKKNWLHTSNKNCYEDKASGLGALTTDYLKLENLMPGIFRKT